MGKPVRNHLGLTRAVPRGVRLGLALGLALTAPRTASAQAEPPARAAPKHYVPVLELSYLDVGSATLPGKEGRPELHVDSDILRIAGMVGHHFADTGTVVAGQLSYELHQVRSQRPDEPASRISLHNALVRIALLQSIGEGWGTMGFLRAGVASDFEGLSWNDVRESTGAAVTYRFDESLRIAVGALYTNAFFGQMILPLVHVRYQRWPYRFNIIVPRGAEGWYAPLPWLELGIRAGSRPLRHGIHGTGHLGEEYANLNVLAGLAARAYVHQGAYVTGEAGYCVRYYKVTEARLKIHELTSFHGIYGALSVGYML